MVEQLEAEAPLAEVRTVLQAAPVTFMTQTLLLLFMVLMVGRGQLSCLRWMTASRPQALQQQRPFC